ncbi:hypothetical protein K4K57_013103 [Colletotrichum sp. SAR 10_99]|nr:hypothetical protein K4K57_013103 [Colletotrichum sp. SAR 10_99]
MNSSFSALKELDKRWGSSNTASQNDNPGRLTADEIRRRMNPARAAQRPTQTAPPLTTVEQHSNKEQEEVFTREDKKVLGLVAYSTALARQMLWENSRELSARIPVALEVAMQEAAKEASVAFQVQFASSLKRAWEVIESQREEDVKTEAEETHRRLKESAESSDGVPEQTIRKYLEGLAEDSFHSRKK